jgi:hypothetical protein
LFSAGDSNLYGYALNDPTNLVDLNGAKPGDLFASEQEAAFDMLNYIKSDAKYSINEWGGFLVKASCGRFTYTDPSTSGLRGTINIGPLPPNATAAYHTHPAKHADNEDFSRDDTLMQDRLVQKINSYLVTPTYQLKFRAPGG